MIKDKTCTTPLLARILMNQKFCKKLSTGIIWVKFKEDDILCSVLLTTPISSCVDSCMLKVICPQLEASYKGGFYIWAIEC